MNTKSLQKKFTMNTYSVIALGIGAMVGAGIFALLGQVVVDAGKYAYISFIVSGAVALFSAYSYIKLAVKYPKAGGIIYYFATAFKSSRFASSLSLLYLLTLAISVAMVSKAFGSYATALFIPAGLPQDWQNIATGIFSAVNIIVLTLLNMQGGADVGKAQVVLVGIKLAILAVLMLAGISSLDMTKVFVQAQPETWTFLGSVGLTFFAYAGFGMMTNAAADVENPEKTMPRAIYLAIFIVMFLYVALVWVVLGALSPADILLYSDTALAQAAKPILGRAGFIAVSFAAIIATLSAVNATLYSGFRIATALGRRRLLPKIFTHHILEQGSWGIVLSIAGILFVTLLFPLRAIANVASISFLICYLAVFVANWKLRKETKAQGWIIILGFLFMLFTLIAFVVGLAQTHPISLGLIACALIIIAVASTQNKEKI